jgi:hypothetical protein
MLAHKWIHLSTSEIEQQKAPCFFALEFVTSNQWEAFSVDTRALQAFCASGVKKKKKKKKVQSRRRAFSCIDYLKSRKDLLIIS